MFVRMTCDLESYIVAVERVKEYAECPQEVYMFCCLCCVFSLVCFSYYGKIERLRNTSVIIVNLADVL